MFLLLSYAVYYPFPPQPSHHKLTNFPLVSVLINGDSQSVVQGVLYLVFGNIFFLLFIATYLVVPIKGPSSTEDWGDLVQVVPRLSPEHPKPHLDHYLLIDGGFGNNFSDGDSDVESVASTNNNTNNNTNNTNSINNTNNTNNHTHNNNNVYRENNKKYLNNTSKIQKSKTIKKIPLPPGERARYCGICQKMKPLRTHHCSTCKRCILKMDHHCPWFGECIGFRNYKAFILSLWWTVLLCIWLFATLLQQLIWELVNDKLHGASVQYLVICSLALLFWIASNSLLAYHLYLLCYNVTTLEHLEMARGDRMNWNCPYSYGSISANYYQVFGEHWWQWFDAFHTVDPLGQGGLTFAKAK